MLIGGALANALVFTGSSYLFHRLSANNIDAERKRHDAAIEALQKAQIEWTHKRQQRIDFINNQLRLERKAETKFTELNDAMREYHEVFGHELPRLPQEPVLSDYYTPTASQRVGIHSVEYDWNWGSSISPRELNYITSCNIITFSLPYMYRLSLQYLRPEPTDFVIPNQLLFRSIKNPTYNSSNDTR